MQLIDDPPVTNPQPVAIPSLKLLDIVVPSIWIGGDLFDLLDNPILPRRRKPRQGRVSSGTSEMEDQIAGRGDLVLVAAIVVGFVVPSAFKAQFRT
jgi:hypothetical protein